MSKSLSVVLSAVVVCLSAVFGVYAQNIDNAVDTFYRGLSPIIEGNMNNPERCLAEVNKYYSANKSLIEKVKQETAQAMQNMGPMMSNYMRAIDDAMDGKTVDASQFEDMGRMAAEKGAKGSVSPTMLRYQSLLQQFTMKTI